MSKDSTVREPCTKKREWLNCRFVNYFRPRSLEWEVCSLRRSLRRHAVHADHLSEKSLAVDVDSRRLLIDSWREQAKSYFIRDATSTVSMT